MKRLQLITGNAICKLFRLARRFIKLKAVENNVKIGYTLKTYFAQETPL